MTDRRAHLHATLSAVTDRIRRACDRAGREPSEVTTIVVTKTYPVSDLRLLFELGIRDVGENRVAEAAGKAAELADLAGVSDLADLADPLRWHMIGQVQTNKAGAVARWADVVHSVDRPRLVDALDRAADRADRTLDVLLQLSLDADPTRGGVPIDGMDDLADQVAGTTRLRLRGVMAVAPLGVDPDRAFGLLAEQSARLRTRYPGAVVVSAGMSGDLEAAIAHGATHLRVGTAILGTRGSLQ